MVLYKRKPVKFVPPIKVENEDTEVWHIPQTGELFTSYEDYLSRMDFYVQPRFNNQITGHSGMSFFDALKSELAGGQEVEAAFPEALKGPVLRKAQFQVVSRLDHLVDMIFDDFRNDYFPGEAVTVSLENSDKKIQGLVRDKTTFGARPLPDGSMSQPVTRYLVDIKGFDEEHAAYGDQVSRDRGVFTKAMIRSFIKKTVTREAWNGAPWLVRPEYAQQYYIDTRVPPHLRYETKLLERKQLQAQKRALMPQEVNGHGPTGSGDPVRLPELKPAGKGHKGKGLPSQKGMKWPQDMAVHGGNPSATELEAVPREPTPPPPPKYPIEDLELPLREGIVRPAMSFLCRDPPDQNINGHTHGSLPNNQLDMDSIGPLLETWDTLNVYCEIFKLDSFTFDDFVEAMCVVSEQVPVQLIDEIHCSVLKVIVDSEADGGKVRITLPQLDEDSSDEDEDDEDEEDEEDEEPPEPEPAPTKRATRSSLAKLEAERLAAEAAAAEAAAEEEKLEAELQTRHRADELLQDYDWVEHLRKRDFPNGGWERIMVGLFYQLSKKERYEDRCDELLLQLVPPGEEPSQETVRLRYAHLDVNYRVKALQIICMLTMETKRVRGYMEECSETMTKYRKERIEVQRVKKAALEELRQLEEQRRALQPPETAPSSPKTEKIEEGEDSRLTVDESLIEKDTEDNADAAADGKVRRGRKKQLSEKQRRKQQEAERKDKEEKLKEKEKSQTVSLTTAQTKQLNKLLKEIQKQETIVKDCEEEVSVIENDLREADCPRTRVMGRDRFWNRYYWFERNGMPYGGLPDSSTASAEYANGCLWIQGPDDLERSGYIDVSQEDQNEYMSRFGITLPERKAKEEGDTSVHNARQWGYICEPSKFEELLNWLDPRGFNELKLKKELVLFKDRIVKHMDNRLKYLAEGNDDRAEETTSKRSSSRIKDKTPEPPNYRCLRWENTTVLEELGHLHSEPPPPPRARKQSRKREANAETAVASTKKTKRK